MSNEVILLLSAIADIVLVFLVARFNPQRLFSTIVINLLLVTVFGAKIATFFGFTTNVGNVFYACAFLATHFILERNRSREAYSSIWINSLFVVGFVFFSQMILCLHGVSSQVALSDAFSVVFSFSPRIMTASLIAFVFAQYVNIRLYESMNVRHKGKWLFLRSNGANMIAQFIDSCIFFSIAFPDMSGMILVQAILAGWVIKSFVVLLGTPVLYIDRFFLRKHDTA